MRRVRTGAYGSKLTNASRQQPRTMIRSGRGPSLEQACPSGRTTMPARSCLASLRDSYRADCAATLLISTMFVLHSHAVRRMRRDAALQAAGWPARGARVWRGNKKGGRVSRIGMSSRELL